MLRTSTWNNSSMHQSSFYQVIFSKTLIHSIVNLVFTFPITKDQIYNPSELDIYQTLSHIHCIIDWEILIGQLPPRYLAYIQTSTALHITNIEISDSIIDCLNTSDLKRFTNIRMLNVTNSMMNKIFCPHSNANTLNNIQHMNFSNNRIKQMGQRLGNFKKLKSLDLSYNHLSDRLDPEEFSTLPETVQILDLTNNLWMCIPTLSWLHSWSNSFKHLHQQLREIQCRIRNSYQMASLLGNMEQTNLTNIPRIHTAFSSLNIFYIWILDHILPRCCPNLLNQSQPSLLPPLHLCVPLLCLQQQHLLLHGHCQLHHLRPQILPHRPLQDHGSGFVPQQSELVQLGYIVSYGTKLSVHLQSNTVLQPTALYWHKTVAGDELILKLWYLNYKNENTDIRI